MKVDIEFFEQVADIMMADYIEEYVKAWKPGCTEQDAVVRNRLYVVVKKEAAGDEEEGFLFEGTPYFASRAPRKVEQLMDGVVPIDGIGAFSGDMRRAIAATSKKMVMNRIDADMRSKTPEEWPCFVFMSETWMSTFEDAEAGKAAKEKYGEVRHMPTRISALALWMYTRDGVYPLSQPVSNGATVGEPVKANFKAGAVAGLKGNAIPDSMEVNDINIDSEGRVPGH